ncbi:MAG: polysaccharide lyase beta-sandwich domain-containing protein [Mediterranea sp.]|jgi:chondroitin AC lyase|nr:polysaccharide lyase beta-sandwich domain-containing protein [Mediterranea sp.]
MKNFLLILLMSACLLARAAGDGAEPNTYVLLERQVAETILERIRADRLTRDRADLEVAVAGYLAKMQPDGSFEDCHYVSRFRNDRDVLAHLGRLREMGIAYAQAGNRYRADERLYAHIVRGLEYWYDQHWTDNNWWQNRIAHPQRLGEVLIALHYGEKDIKQEPVFEKLVHRWREEMGDPDTPRNPTTAGANKCDIALHWIYRSCLTINREDLEKAVESSFLIVDYTMGEGLQVDGSYHQHGPQLYIGGYGVEFVQLVTRQAYYLAGTPYALSPEKLELFSSFVRDTFLKTIRGKRLNLSVLGRRITRTDGTGISGLVPILEMLKSVDFSHAGEYEAAIKRLSGAAPASYGLQPSHVHYHRSEYTLHQRPGYTFDVRMASKRLARSEYDKSENRQGFFLTDGATGIYVDGEEYASILPLWNWKRIPGTTAPDLAVMRRADNYIFNGRSDCAGAATNGTYGVVAFDMVNDQSLYAFDDDAGLYGVPQPTGARLPALDFGARKSWFIFDKEIVCLGSGIYSGHDEPVYTTVNQCRQAGALHLVTEKSLVLSPGKDVYEYGKVKWVLNDKVAYFFPTRPTVHLAWETRKGTWRDINSGGSPNLRTEDVFTLWLDHGVKPRGESYAYIIVPNIQTAKEAGNYPVKDIEILACNDSVQAVYHRGLDAYGLAFFEAAAFESSNLTVSVDAACVIMIDNASTDQRAAYIADPRKRDVSIKLKVKMPVPQ